MWLQPVSASVELPALGTGRLCHAAEAITYRSAGCGKYWLAARHRSGCDLHLP